MISQIPTSNAPRTKKVARFQEWRNGVSRYYVAIGFERPGATAASCCRILSMSNGIVVSALERLRSPDSGMAVGLGAAQPGKDVALKSHAQHFFSFPL
jgi:hypothetical protein